MDKENRERCRRRERDREQVWYYSTRQTVLLNDFLQGRAQKKTVSNKIPRYLLAL